MERKDDVHDDRNEFEKNENKDFLEELGLDVERVEFDPEETSENGFMKLSSEVPSELSAILQYIPGMAAHRATSKAAEASIFKMAEGAYKVSMKEGTHLAKIKAEDAFLGGLLSDDTNKLAGQARWYKLDPVAVSKAPQYINGFFNTVSLVTGQYYLSEINSKLTNIETSVKSVLDYLEDDKKSALWASIRTLDKYFHDLDFIMKYETQKNASLNEVKEIKRRALADINFFDNRVRKSSKETSVKTKTTNIEENVVKSHEYLLLYRVAVGIYLKAQFLEIILSSIDDPEYLDRVQRDLHTYIDMYSGAFKACRQQFYVVLSQHKKLNSNFNLKYGLESVAESLEHGSVTLAVLFSVDSLRGQIDKQVKTRKRNKIERTVSDCFELCQDVEPLKRICKDIDEYKKLRNDPIDLYLTPGGIYVKYLDDPR